LRAGITLEQLAQRGLGFLPGLIGVRFTAVAENRIEAELDIRAEPLAPNGYLHAATIIALADTARLWLPRALRRPGRELHDNRAQEQLSRDRAHWHDSLRRDAGSSGQRDPDLGCSGQRSRYE
jgi:hypothetical protein